MIPKTWTALFFAIVLCGCATDQGSKPTPSALSRGAVQLTLRKGITTQAEVLEKFGGPNIATLDASGREVWTYERHATVSESSESAGHATILLLGAGTRSSRSRQSSRTMTLIIKFESDKTVADFNSLYTTF